MPFRNSASLGYGILGIIAFGIFSVIMWQKQPDLYDHVVLSQRLLNGDLHYANFLYYLVVAGFGFFSKNLHILQFSGVLVLTLCVLAKYHLAFRYVKDGLANGAGGSPWAHTNYLPLWVLGLCLAINFPVNLSATWYLGQFSPNLWHNSTTIFLMPFALLLFFEALHYVENPEWSVVWRMSLWVVLGALIKPSFLFAFVPVFPLVVLWKYKFGVPFFKALIPLVFSFLGIAWVWIYNFITNTYNEGGGIEVAPFKVWSNWSENIPLSTLASLAFPLAVVLAEPSSLKRRLDLRFAWWMMAPALLVYILFAEKGSNWIVVASNFSWQLIVCNFILFMVSLKAVFQMDQETKWFGYPRRTLLLGLFLLHVLFGVLYLVKIPIFGYR